MVLTAVLLAFMFAAVAEAGPAGCTNCTVAIDDINGDGISDLFLQKNTGANDGLLRTNRLDGVNAAQGAIFVNSGSEFSAYGGGKVSSAVGSTSQRDYWVLRKTSGTNEGLVRVVKTTDTGAAGGGNTFIPVPLDYSLIGIADMDNDGIEDLVYRKEGAPNEGLVRVLFMDAAGDLKLIVNFMGLLNTESQDNGYKVLGIGDMNGDSLADVVSVKVSGGNQGLYRVNLTSATCPPPALACFGGASSVRFPGIANAAYESVGIAYNNDDNFADLVTVTPKTSVSPVPGLVRVLKTKDAQVEGFEVPIFPLLLPNGTNFEIKGWGNYDGLHQADILAWNPVNSVVGVWILNAAGDGLSSGGTGFPLTADNTWDFSNGAPVIGP